MSKAVSLFAYVSATIRVESGYEHPVRKRDAVGYAASRAVGCGQRDDAGSELLAGHQVEAAAVDVGIAPTIHDELVPCRRIGEASQVGVGHE